MTRIPPMPASPWLLSRERIMVTLFMVLFWVLGTYAFITQTVSYSLFLKVTSPLVAVCELAFAVLGLMVLRSRLDIGLIGSFMVLSWVSSCVFNGLPLLTWFNGTRLYYGLLFMPPVLRYLLRTRERSNYFIGVMDRALYIFLWIQVPCLVYQYVALGGWDHGGGSLGDLNSGPISFLIYTISFYLMLKRWDSDAGYFPNLRRNWDLLFLLFPTMLNETKVSLILVAMYFFFLIPHDDKFAKRMMWAVPLICVMLTGAGALYLSLNTEKGDDVFDVEHMEDYLIGDDNTAEMIEYYMENTDQYESDEDFARGAKFAVLPAIINDEPWSTYIGFGLGNFKGGKSIKKTRFAREHTWLVGGTQMQLMIILIDMGIAGVIWFLVYIWTIFRWGRGYPHRNTQIEWFLLLCTFMVLLYGSIFTLLCYDMIFIYLVYLSSRWNLVTDAAGSEMHDRAERRRLSEEMRLARKRAARQAGDNNPLCRQTHEDTDCK